MAKNSNFLLLISLITLSSQIINGFFANKERFSYPLVEYPFEKENIARYCEKKEVDNLFNFSFIPLHYKMWLQHQYFQLKNNLISFINGPYNIVTYSSIFGFNHSFARGCYQIFTDGKGGKIETIKVFTENGNVPKNSDRSGFMKPLNLHVVYGVLGIIYYKITKAQSLETIDYNDHYWLDNLFNFSGQRYFNQTGSYPLKSTLLLNTINVPSKYVGYYNGVEKKNLLKIIFNHETCKKKLIYAPPYSHNFNQLELDIFRREKINFFLD